MVLSGKLFNCGEYLYNIWAKLLEIALVWFWHFVVMMKSSDRRDFFLCNSS